MKKLNGLGKVLTRQEMKSVSGGGLPQCDDSSVCGPPCAATTDPHNLIEVGWSCSSDDSGGPKRCRPYQCRILIPE